MFSFIDSVIIKMLQENVKDTTFNLEFMLLPLRNKKYTIIDDKVITCVFVKNANLIAKMCNYEVSVEITLNTCCVRKSHRDG